MMSQNHVLQGFGEGVFVFETQQRFTNLQL